MAFEHEDSDSHFRQGSPSTRLVQPQGLEYYGAIGSGFGSTTFNEDDSGVDFEDDYELLLDEQLAQEGLYRGNYRNQVLLYTVVPLTTLLSFICLALVPTMLVFPTETDSTPSLFPYPPYLPFPILEMLTSTALWSLSYLLRDFLYATALFIASPLTIITITLSSTLQTISNLLLRQLVIPILLIPYYSSEHLAHLTWQDDAFRRVWWVALGWAAVEAVVGVKQGYESIALYKDVLVSVNTPGSGQGESRNTYAMDANKKRPGAAQHQCGDEREDVDAAPPRQMNWENQQGWLSGDLTASPTQRTGYSRSRSVGSNQVPMEGHPSPILNERQPLLRVPIQRPNDGLKRLQAENEVERDLDQLIAMKNREELEEVYGMPVIHIPVFISCLHRINSILSSLGICLLLTTAYMQSTFAIPTPPTPLPLPTTPSFSTPLPNLSSTPSNKPLLLTTLPILFIYVFLAMMHTPLILPRIGIHTFVYVELLVSLGVFFGGLAVWDVLS